MLTAKVRDGFVVIVDDKRRTVQRAVSPKSFKNLSKGRYDAVLVSGEKGTSDNVFANSPKEVSVWFAVELAFVRMKSGKMENGLCSFHKKKSRME